ncbi:unnamed protein product, partial [Closterium sp. NIES-53]
VPDGTAGQGRTVEEVAMTGPPEGSARETATGRASCSRAVRSRKKQREAPESSVKVCSASVDAVPASADGQAPGAAASPGARAADALAPRAAASPGPRGEDALALGGAVSLVPMPGSGGTLRYLPHQTPHAASTTHGVAAAAASGRRRTPHAAPLHHSHRCLHRPHLPHHPHHRHHPPCRHCPPHHPHHSHPRHHLRPPHPLHCRRPLVHLHHPCPPCPCRPCVSHW